MCASTFCSAAWPATVPVNVVIADALPPSVVSLNPSKRSAQCSLSRSWSLLTDLVTLLGLVPCSPPCSRELGLLSCPIWCIEGFTPPQVPPAL
jgi:hypothetical protein